ncbi:MAG: threonine synthase [Planctomycetota bacterium]|nr:threonine synthase [Planctomycetota bacterium]
MTSAFTHLECSACGARRTPTEIVGVCDCGETFLARYDLERARAALGPRPSPGRRTSFWEYAPLLPVLDPANRVTLGEGGAPVIPSRRWGARHGLSRLLFQWEGSNPTLSFKARGAACAISRAKELGIRKVALPSAGNAGSALAAYAAAAGMEALVVVPEETPGPVKAEARAFGAEVMEVAGGLPEASRALAQRAESEGWFVCSTWMEPYRVEGKKTMAFEIAGRFGEDLPDVIIFPTGGGVGTVAFWKAFDEMEGVGWIGTRRPRLVAVQLESCAPIVRAMDNGDETLEPWLEPGETDAAGLKVPAPRAGKLILKALRASRGTAIGIPENELSHVGSALGKEEGLWTSPEGAAAAAAAPMLLDTGWLGKEEKILVFLTASGLKYG